MMYLPNSILKNPMTPSYCPMLCYVCVGTVIGLQWIRPEPLSAEALISPQPPSG